MLVLLTLELGGGPAANDVAPIVRIPVVMAPAIKGIMARFFNTRIILLMFLIVPPI